MQLYKSQIFIPQAFTRSKGSHVSMPSCTTSPARIGDGMATKGDLLRAHKAEDITRKLLLNQDIASSYNVMHVQKNCQQSSPISKAFSHFQDDINPKALATNINVTIAVTTWHLKTALRAKAVELSMQR